MNNIDFEDDINNAVLDLLHKNTKEQNLEDITDVFNNISVSLAFFNEDEIIHALAYLKTLKIMELSKIRGFSQERYNIKKRLFTALEFKLNEHFSRGRKGNLFEFLKTVQKEITEYHEGSSEEKKGFLGIFRR